MAFGEIVRVFFLNFGPTGAAQGFRGMPFVTSLPLVAVLAVLVAILAARTAASRMGRAFAAMTATRAGRRGDGHRRHPGELASFTVGAVVAGLAGALWAHYVQFIEPEEFGFARSVMPFTFVVVGGLQTFWGSLVGAAVLTLLPEWLRFLKEWRLALYGVAMLAVMIVRPQGLVDHRLVERCAVLIPGHAKEALS